MNFDGTIQEVELAMITSSSASVSISANTFCFSDRFSGVHSYTKKHVMLMTLVPTGTKE